MLKLVAETCAFSGCNWLRVIESSDFSGNFHATNVLVDHCEDPTVSGKTTYWRAPGRTTGLNAHFIVELGCNQFVDRVTLRNTIDPIEQYDNKKGLMLFGFETSLFADLLATSR